MPVPHVVAVGIVVQELESEVVDGLEQPEAIRLPHHKAGTDERVDLLAPDAHGLGRVGLEATREHPEVTERPRRLRRQEVDTPRDGRAQRLLPTRPFAGAVRRQVEACGEVVRQLVEGHLAHSCGRELDGERQSVQPQADLLDRRSATGVEAVVRRGRRAP